MSSIIVLLKPFFYFYLSLKLKFRLSKFQVLWRSKNAHNYTSVGRMFPMQCVDVGSKTYGELNVYSYSNGIDEKLTIGNYVSIANHVSFILGGNHSINTFTTYPLKNFVLNQPFQDAFSRGEIVIGDEVWIGFGATILSGVKVGKGAIIAAGALVVKDIPPYAIVGGNPAKTIRFRFDQDIIDELSAIELIHFNDKDIIQHIENFYSPIESTKDLMFLKNRFNEQ